MECRECKKGEEEHLGRHVNYLSRLIKTACNSELAKCGADITGEQCRLMGYIAFRTDRGEEVFQRDIEREFGIRRSSAASILAHLERGGYIERMGDSSDGRIKRVILTEKGRELDERMKNVIDGVEECIAMGMTEEERAEFLRLVKKAAGNFEPLGCGRTEAGDRRLKRNCRSNRIL
ncbi:MAG: MarR family transcriptional regulator [Ruminococcus sp.]|nr:MarR family transcriptional regulator [Ruminococcus sp.]